MRRHIILGKEAFNKIVCGKLEHNLKKRLIKALIWSGVLHKSETSTMQKEDINRLEACEMWLWRRKMKVKWMEHKTSEAVLEMVKEKRMLIKIIRERRNNWVGHTLRSDSLLQTVWEGRR
jgi:hypothetical protein